MTNEERAREVTVRFDREIGTTKDGCNALFEYILSTLDAACAGLVAERDRLREALKPFAEEADLYEPYDGDDRHVAWASTFPIGDLRRARSALAEKDPSNG